MTAELILKDKITCKTIHSFEKSLNGVYILTHINSCKMYIGFSSNLYSSICSNKTKLKNGIHASKLLQDLYNENKYISFLTTITNTKEDAIKLKQEILNKYINSGKLFNISNHAEKSAFGLAKTLAFIKNVKERLSKPISINGTAYSGFNEASKILCINQQSVSYRVNSDRFPDWVRL